MPDGGLLHTAMAAALRPATGTPALPAEPDIDPLDVADVTTAATGWLTWWEERHAVPVGVGSAWQPDRLTYEFSVAAPDGAGAELVAPEHVRAAHPDCVRRNAGGALVGVRGRQGRPRGARGRPG
jgi:hypothetical protein